ncbi:MAG: hypothetical protein HC840_12135 [Leptolyngbyaceae cyanobacterium RM2_2_4]|nr:hypothetical protein [Leptolyngbyaceae cyanobacterium SL_5_14]NJO50054.1 hypothetical protein [Leptolyngbyaceae cyanobacterium RM2_2_4]
MLQKRISVVFCNGDRTIVHPICPIPAINFTQKGNALRDLSFYGGINGKSLITGLVL